jgi:hypothetical protein
VFGSKKNSMFNSVYSPPSEMEPETPRQNMMPVKVQVIEEVKTEPFESEEDEIKKPNLVTKNWIWKQVVKLLTKSKVELDQKVGESL